MAEFLSYLNDLIQTIAAEIAAGQGLRLGAAARRFPTARQVKKAEGGKKGKQSDAPSATSAATIWRWIVEGVRAADGSRVKLEALKTPSGWMTSEPALARFLARLQGVPVADGTATTGTTPAPRRRQHQPRADVAGQALQNAGL